MKFNNNSILRNKEWIIFYSTLRKKYYLYLLEVFTNLPQSHRSKLKQFVLRYLLVQNFSKYNLKSHSYPCLVKILLEQLCLLFVSFYLVVFLNNQSLYFILSWPLLRIRNFGFFRRFRRLRRFEDFFFFILKLFGKFVPFGAETGFFFPALLLLGLRGGQFRWHITLINIINHEKERKW